MNPKLIKDKNSLFLLRFNIVGFSAIASTIILYSFLIPYGTHFEAIITGIVIGLIIAISLQITLHKLTILSKKQHG